MAPLLHLDAEHVVSLLDPARHARLGVRRTRGPARLRTADAVAWVLVERGDGELRVDGETVAVRGRGDVFEGPGWSALLGPGTDAALDGDVDATVVWRASDRAVASIVIDPATVPDETRGGERRRGACARTSRRGR